MSVSGWWDRTRTYSASVTVQVAFGDEPLETAQTWTDISAYVRRIVARRGRSHELDRFMPGKMNVTLDNSDQRFDPLYSSGAYYPDVKPMVQIRFRLTYDGTTATLWQGFVESWPQDWPGHKDSVTEIGCVDGFKLLELATVDGTISGARSDTMAGDVLDDISWPAAWRNLQTGETTCDDVVGYDTPALSLLRLISDSENGALLMARSGNVRLVNRNFWCWDNRTSVGTFGPGSGEWPYQKVRFGYDDFSIWNKVTVERQGGDPQTVSNAASVAAYGTRHLTRRGLILDDDQDAADTAGWLLRRYKEPALRVKELRFNPASDPTNLWDHLLETGIGAKVTVKRTPPGGNGISVDCHVEGIVFDVTPARFRVSYDLSPATLQTWWILGTSELGTDTIVGY